MIARELEDDLNRLVPAERGSWPNLVGAIGRQHGRRLQLLGNVEPARLSPLSEVRIWGSGPHEGAVFDLLVMEWWSPIHLAEDVALPERRFLVASGGSCG